MKIVKSLFCVVLILVLFSGCSTSQGVSHLTIVQGIGIDKDDDKTMVTIQYLNLSKSSGNTDSLQGEITDIIAGSANSISNAISSASKNVSQDIFLGQNKIIVFGNEFVKGGIHSSLDYLLRSVDSRPDVLVALSSDKAQDIIKSSTKNSHVPAESIYNLMLTGEKNGISCAVRVNELLNLYTDKTCDIFMPVLSSNDKDVRCEGIAYFSGNKLAGELKDEMLLGFLIINSRVDNASLMIKDERLGDISVQIVKSHSKNRAIVRNNKVTFCSDIKVEIVLSEVERGITVAVNEDEIKRIERLTSQKIESMCYSCVTECLSNKSDPFMISRYVAKENIDFFKFVKPKWHEKLKNISYDVTVQTNLDKVNDNSIHS